MVRDRAELFGTAVLAIVGLLLICPAVLLVLYSFQVQPFGHKVVWGFSNWITATSDRLFQEALFNTFVLAVTRQGIALIIGIVLAWLIARSNLPGRNHLEFGFWIALLLPTLPVLLGWVMLLDPDRGLVNRILIAWLGLESAPFNLFSWWGIVYVHIVTTTLPIKVMLFVPAFRNLDAALEEASRISGAGRLETIVRIVIPVLAPTIIVVMLLGTIRSLQAFEVEQILGVPAGIHVYSTLIYEQVFRTPPEYGAATALSLLIVMLIVPFVVLQQRVSAARAYTTVSGKFNPRVNDLGRWRWPAFAIVFGMLLLMTLVPIAFLIMSSSMTLFGYFHIPEPFTLRHWETTLQHPIFISGLHNTLWYATGAGLVAVMAYSLIAYAVVRVRFWGQGLLDFVTWLPLLLPGIVMSFGFLWLFVGTPFFRPLYGTVWILIIASIAAGMTLGVQILKVAIKQIGQELEESSRIAGASQSKTVRSIVLPLIGPAVAVVGVLNFANAASQISGIVLLSTHANRPLAILQLEYMEEGSYERAAVVGVIVLGLTLGAAVVARIIALRHSIGS